ncbi:MAG: 7,8-didemethyl-8-hydroxy-5-deazariboflavin synthase CofG [Thermoproteota archaeon]|nr:7,8-didemethyl-8-hydroxy-5-deazariboflavin synthase CofG [Thermoproteota archaeon]
MHKFDLQSMEEKILRKSMSKKEIYDLMIRFDTLSLISLANSIRRTCRPGPITYSRKVFINLVNLCRDKCAYCTYKKEPSDTDVSMLVPEKVLKIAEDGKKLRCTEALIVTGESPEQKYPEARRWLRSMGFSSTAEYIDKVSSMILEQTGLLPHTNGGILNQDELSILKETNVSLGCMLESSSERLLRKNMPHEFAPSKNPKARKRILENAGKLKIPMTTGVLVGIGETVEEIVDSLFMISEINEKYGNIQEVIIQNFVPKSNTAMREIPTPSVDYFIRSIAISRIIMPDMNIQVPPNLSPNYYGQYIDAGINDWGGISPLTIDHVNPQSPWPDVNELTNVTKNSGYLLKPRLPIYPEFIIQKGEFIHDNLWKYVRALAGSDGLVREDYLN